jgi:biopolymer transport protein ExbD
MFYHRRRHDSLRLELTPLLDIIFILLIFFAVSTSLMTHYQGLELALPQAETVSEEKAGLVISVTVNKDIIINEQQVPLSTLSTVIQTVLTQNPDTKMILNADQNLSYSFIVEILDKIRLGGTSDIILQAEKVILNDR